MEDILAAAVQRALALGAGYADARYVRTQTEDLTTKNGRVDALGSEESAGVGVRVLVDGAFGFFAVGSTEQPEVIRAAEEAVAIARASSRAMRDPVVLAPARPARDRYRTPLRLDPFEVPWEERVSLLLDCDAAMRAAADVRVTEGSIAAVKEHKLFVNSEGSSIEQEIVHAGASISATVVDADEMQVRSYPAGHGDISLAGGWEEIQALDLVGAAPQVAREAVELLTAEPCPSEILDVLLKGSQMALQVHESCGHPIELDRVFGTEASFAGTSFLTVDLLGKLRYGSEQVNIVADATCPGGLGTFAFDDEGVPGQRTPIVERGIFCGYLSSREAAARLGQILGPGSEPTSSGAMRAEGYNHIPLVRMTNINLLPGDWTLEEMIRETRHGILMATNRSWSIDDRRLNFQFGCEIGWRIEDGSLGSLVRNPTYTGMTPQFWNSCDAVAGESEWRMWGVSNCGKGEPIQTMRVGHGTAPARFRQVRAGILP